MSTVRPDLVAALLELVRQAAREGAAEAFASGSTNPPPVATELVDKRTLARALGVSTSKIDRLCAIGAIPFLPVGDTRRFQLPAVLAALAERKQVGRGGGGSPELLAPGRPGVQSVRLLSRRGKP